MSIRIGQRGWHRVVLLFAALAVGACGSSGGDVPGQFTPMVPQATASFSATEGTMPYPNDVYFFDATGNPTADGTIQVPVTPSTLFNFITNGRDGFSNIAPITLFFSGSVDAASVSPGENIVVAEVTIDNVLREVTDVVRVLTAGDEYTVDFVTGTAQNVIMVTPTLALAPRSSYMVLVTGGITPAVGGTYARADAYASAASAGAPLGPLAAQIQSHLASAADAGVTADEVIVSTSFTTQSVRETLEAVANAATPQFSALSPTGLTTAQVVPGSSGAADIFVGVTQVPYFLSRAEPLSAMWRGPNDSNLTAANPLPVATETVTIPVLITTPSSNSAFAQAGGVRPIDGWPVVIMQHGITGNRTNAFGVIDTLADAGFAVVAIDQPLHGLTDPSSPLFIPDTERTFDLDLIDNATGAMVEGGDGLIDPSGTHFFNLPLPRVAADNNRQTVADLFALAATIPTIDLDGTPLADLDGDNMHFVGHSLGAMNGTAFLALSDTVDVALLSVPGASVINLLVNSASFGPVVEAGLNAAGLPSNSLPLALFLRDAQQAIDVADPANFALEATTRHPILLHEVIGNGAGNLPDQVVPNVATDRYIAEAAIPLFGSPGVNMASLGAVQFTAGGHGSLLSPADSLATTIEMQTQMVVFIAGNPGAGIPGGGQVILISDQSVVQPQP